MPHDFRKEQQQDMTKVRPSTIIRGGPRIKRLIKNLQSSGSSKNREEVIETIINNDWTSWVDWSFRDLAEELASLHRGEPRLSDLEDHELIDILMKCPECDKPADLDKSVESDGYLFHKKCMKE